jgi:hypothetical protein
MYKKIMTKEEKIAVIIVFIIISIAIFKWAISPASPSYFFYEEQCIPDYMGGCW